MAEITINGKTFPLTGDPTHKTTWAVKNSQRQLLTDIVMKYKDKINFNEFQSVQAAIGKILMEAPSEVAKIEGEKEQFNWIATISLATGNLFTSEEFEDMSEKKFRAIYEKCKAALGSDANGFFSFYEPNSSSKMNAGRKMPSGTTSPET